MAKNEDDIIKWITLKGGKHIPIRKGQSTADAIKSALANDSKGAKPSKGKAETQSKPKSEEKSKVETDKRDQEMKKASENAKKMNDESKYQEALSRAKKEKTSIKNGRLQFNGKDAPEFSTADAMHDWKSLDKDSPKEGAGDSLSRNMRDGKITPERQEVHRKIIEEYFEGHLPYAPEDTRVAMFTGGGGASGKGQFSGTNRETGERNVGKFYSQDKNPLVVDPDELKSKLAKADGALEWYATSTDGAPYYHEESSALAKQIYELALEHDYPVLYDGTATGGGIFKLLESAKKYGRRTEMNFLVSDLETVLANSAKRYERGQSLPNGVEVHRVVPLARLLGAHQKSFKAISKLQDQFDSFTLWDNAQYKMTKVGTSSLGKKLSILSKDSWDRITRSEAEFTLDEFSDKVRAYNDRIAQINKKIAEKLKGKKK